MVESSTDGLREVFVLTILGDGAACADDDLINEVFGEHSSVEEEGCCCASSSSSTSGKDNDDSLYNNSSSLVPRLPFCCVDGDFKSSPAPPQLLEESQ